MLFGNTKSLPVNVQEGYDVWSLLNHRFIIINHFRTQANVIHDKDFKHILNSHLMELEKETYDLEKKLTRINTKGPEPAVKEVSSISNPEVSRDLDIARIYYLVFKNEINKLLKIFRSTTTNDELRSDFLNLTKKSLNRYYDFEQFLKLKDWAEKPPLYRYVPEDAKAKISTAEIYYLWEHLTYRSTNIHLTNILSKYVDDIDFKKVLQIGLNTLEDQRAKLENLLLKFGVTLPPKYTNIFPEPEDKNLYEDKFIFRVIITGMQNAAALHGDALVDALINDEVRNLFKKLIFEELDIIHNMDKYGKLKGWVLTVPGFNMETDV